MKKSGGSMSAEIWKDVVDEEGRYLVSNQGQVKSLKFGGHDGGGERIMAPISNGWGYTMVKLSDRKLRLIHRLVAEAFLGPIPDGMVVNHKNGIRDDNRLENLEYISQRENIIHARDVLGKRLGLPSHRGYGTPEFVHPRQDKPNHGKVKFSWQTAQLIIKCVEIGYPKKKLARDLRCAPQTIRDIVNGKTLAYQDYRG